MGWLWSSDSSKKEAVNSLDPSLRGFLEESSSSKPVKPVDPPPNSLPTTDVNTTAEVAKPLVPKESLFQDGRYAHLWKNYEPFSVVHEKGLTESDRLQDIADEYKERAAECSSAAEENCSKELEAYLMCLREGGYMVRLTGCRTTLGELSRCTGTQAKMLKAMGYLSFPPEATDKRDRIQLEADKMYRRRMEEDGRAKESGPPKDEREKGDTSTNQPDFTEQEWSSFNKKQAEDYQSRLSKFQGWERELEVKVIRAEYQKERDLVTKLTQVNNDDAEQRRARREAGKETFSDRIKRFTNSN